MAVLGGNSIDHGFAYAGMVVDSQLHNTVSKLNTGTTNIVAGSGVVSSGDDGAALPTAASVAAEFVGIVKYELNRVLNASGEAENAKRDMSIVTVGPVYVVPTVDVEKDDPVYMIVGSSAPGEFTNVVGASTTLAVLVPNAKYTSTADAGGFAKVSLGLGG